MPLEQNYLKRVKQWLKTKWTNYACPMCGGTSLEIGDLTVNFAVPDYDGGSFTISLTSTDRQPVTTTLPVSCTNCGYSIFIASRAVK